MITGASSGIGRGLAQDVARRGAKVGLVARRADALSKLQTDIEAAGGRALFGCRRRARRGIDEKRGRSDH